MILVTDRQLAEALLCPLARAVRWGVHLRPAMERWEITTPRRVAHFLGQIGHESAGLYRVEESGNYSPTRLLEVFPRYFTAAQAAAYARQPSRILSRVYASRMGNGSEASGDGWLYRGRSPVQVTGKDNYRRMGILLDLPLLASPDLLLQLGHGANAAAAWWGDNGLNALADTGNVLAVSRRVNLGSATSKRTPNGLQDRIDRTHASLRALGAT